MTKPSKGLFALLAVSTALFILTLSIALPIVVRPFYYLQITPLGIEESTGYPRSVIVEAYDEMLDFCLFNAPFGTGSLPFSESGKSHFADVAVLFRLDFLVAIGSGIVLAAYGLLRPIKKLQPARPLGRGFGFWASTALLATIAIIAALASTDFTRAFTIFHTLFFPGKDNWIFDGRVDAIINILPEAFFMNCAICIGVVLCLLCVTLITLDFKGHLKPKKAKKG